MGIMLALYILPIKQILLLTLIKVFLQALISGTFFSYIFIFSFVGSFASVFAMLLSKNIFKFKISFLGICLSGALANNLSQLLLSYIIVFKSSTSYIAPILLISGFISAIVLGFLTQKFVDKSIWYSSILKDDSLDKNSELSLYELEEITESVDFSSIKKKKSKKFYKSLFSSIMLLFSIVFFSLLIPSGKLLFSIGSFKITQDALFLGLKRGLILILSVYVSKLIVAKLPPLKGMVGNFINLVLLYFKELASFDSEKSKGKLFEKLDNHLIKVYNSSLKKIKGE